MSPKWLSRLGAAWLLRTLLVVAPLAWPANAQPATSTLQVNRVTPNLDDASIERPLRYHPEGADFVIENGGEFFNRPLYGGNTAFRVDAGDMPEFSLYLPGRGGNLRLGLRSARGAKWLHEAARVTARYRPGEMLYEIRDPLLGPSGVLQLTAIALDQAEGLIVRATLDGSSDVELVWAFGGVTGKRGKRDGDIGTEAVPIGEYFQLQPEFCRGNEFTIDAARFTVRSRSATLRGEGPADATLAVGDAAEWSSCAALVASGGARSETPVVVGHVALLSGTPRFLAVVRNEAKPRAAVDLDTYREVTAPRVGQPESATAGGAGEGVGVAVGVGRPLAGASNDVVRPERERVRSLRSEPSETVGQESLQLHDLPRVFADAEAHFTVLRGQVRIDTPDPFINAAAGALNVAADAVWDEPQGAIMHGAIAWRTRLLGWRGPYALDALGWTGRARRNFRAWAAQQNMSPIPERLPPPDAKANLARSETALHSNGDLSNSHYDMNAVFIDALFRHLEWTGDWALARELWPMIERHLAWERRLFRREFGPDKLPLYEAYAMIWASDDLQYSGGGVTHASAYNYWHNQMAARLARELGADPAPYEREATLIARGMRTYLWIRDGDSSADGERGHFAEFKDLLGRQLVHPSAALWTFYHTLDSGLPTETEAWQMTRDVDEMIPHLPVRGPGVPTDAAYHVLASSNWMPYTWSINNVVMGENVHTALGYWQAGRPEEAFRLMKSALLASMFMGICPGNVGSMNYLDVYRRESQRDFADGSGVLSRALMEGLFGIRPDALAGELRVVPGFPSSWKHARVRHPLVSLEFRREERTDLYSVVSRWQKPMALRLQVAVQGIPAEVKVNGAKAAWTWMEGPARRIEIACPAAASYDVVIRWEGVAEATVAWERGSSSRSEIGRGQGASAPRKTDDTKVVPPSGSRGAFDWRAALPVGSILEPIALERFFNDRVTEIFRPGKYLSPRSPFVSLSLPSQGIGAWAGHVNATAEIDDAGLRRVAAENAGKLMMPNGVSFVTPGPGQAANICFTSQWDNYPREATVPLNGHATHLFLLMAGSTNPMQSRLDNGEVVVAYTDGTTSRLALRNPETWWPIEQDYFIDDFQFRVAGPLPPRVDLKTGAIRLLDPVAFKGRGREIPGGAATVLELSLDPRKELRSLTVRALANDVVIGLMAATLARE